MADRPPEVARPSPATIERAAAQLRAGRLVAIPTETVYGLAADATSDLAVAAVFEAKARPRFNPLIVHYSEAGPAEADVVFDARARTLAAAFWPGPLTLVLPRRRGTAVSFLAGAGLDTLAVRVPGHPVARAILAAAGRPIAAPSANRFGETSPTTAAHVACSLGRETALIVDGGPCQVGLESTVVGLSGPAATLLRPGGITRAALEAIVGPLVSPDAVDTAPSAPGRLARHYATRLALRLDARTVGADEALLAFGRRPLEGAAAVRNLSRAGDLREAGANLFAMLRALDDPRYRAIAVMVIPEDGLGQAINDRLRRAAAPAEDVGTSPETEAPFRLGDAMANDARIPPPAAEGPVLDRIRDAVGPKGWIDDPAAMAPYLEDQRRLYRGRSPLVVRPATTAEVAAVVRLCAEARISVVPQGGNTSLCGGAVPDETGAEIVLGLGRLNRIRVLDALNYTMTVEAGCVLADIQQAAAEADRLFPLSLGAEGSCQIGGNLSTNAGGTAVLRYGNARELVLGLEVVLPDGRVWDGLRALRKDNTGYDLKHLFIGAEGTLGIITAAVLKLFPRPCDVVTALVALAELEGAVELLARARAASSDAVTGFELMEGEAVALAVGLVPNTTDPFPDRYEHYVLIELSAGRVDAGLRGTLESLLSTAFEDSLVVDAVIAASEAQAAALWRVREAIPEAQMIEGTNIKHDVSVPVSRTPAFIREASARCRAAMADVRIYAFGHVGDGNVHFNLAWPADTDQTAARARLHDLSRIVHDVAAEMGGSFSAEHGVGRLKRHELARYAAPVEIDLMRRLKAALDPQGIMNPDTVIPEEGSG